MKDLKPCPETKNRFSFVEIGIDEDTKNVLNLKLMHLLTIAPPGAMAYGTIEKIGSSHLAKLAIVSPYRVFSARAISPHPEIAIKRVLEKVEDQVSRWRFGGSNGGPSSFAHLPSRPSYLGTS